MKGKLRIDFDFIVQTSFGVQNNEKRRNCYVKSWQYKDQNDIVAHHSEIFPVSLCKVHSKNLYSANEKLKGSF